MHTEHQHHEVAEPHETGRRFRVLAEARRARERMCGKDMAVLCVSNALDGAAICVAIAIGLGLGGLPVVQRSRRVIVHCGSDRMVRHGRRGCGRGHGCGRLAVVERKSWLPPAWVGVGNFCVAGQGLSAWSEELMTHGSGDWGRGRGRRKQLLGREPWAQHEKERPQAFHGAGPAAAGRGYGGRLFC
jgi:hypothetical protein